MKNVIILLLCLSLLLCSGCQAAGNDTGTEPTAAPTATPTEEPTQEPTIAPTVEPTQMPTEPPLPAGPIDAELKWVGTLGSNLDISSVLKYWSQPLHSKKEIQDYLNTFFGVDIDGRITKWYWEINYTRYDEAFFAENSVIVIPMVDCYHDSWLWQIANLERKDNGEYLIEMEWGIGEGINVEGSLFFVMFIELKGVTDSAPVELKAAMIHDVNGPVEGAVWHDHDEIAPGVLISYTRE